MLLTRFLFVENMVFTVDSPEGLPVVGVDDLESSVQLGPGGSCGILTTDPFPSVDLVLRVDTDHHVVS